MFFSVNTEAKHKYGIAFILGKQTIKAIEAFISILEKIMMLQLNLTRKVQLNTSISNQI